ncbi:piggyBac transposable element-derived protein 4-like [Hydra vulgaris]|uniref:piggyBac transposable element-derived protein 4-like n=1 Tax=Hydra vulgaris TaxID=6087 RepID=UPI0032E9D186
MASYKRTYSNMEEILKIVMDESSDDMDLEFCQINHVYKIDIDEEEEEEIEQNSSEETNPNENKETLFSDQLFDSTRENEIKKKKEITIEVVEEGHWVEEDNPMLKINQQGIELISTWERVKIDNTADPIIPFFELEDFIDKNPNKASNEYVGNWEPVTVLEIKKYLALVLLMGIIYKPDIHMYWSTSEFFSTPIFSKNMSRTRFQLILKFLHFNNNNDPNYDVNDENRDRLHKVRPLIELIRDRCKKVFCPGQNLSVDESLVLFKGRLHFKQYIRTKRARFDIKLYELTTSSGITLDFLVYCGKGMFYEDGNEDMPSTERIPAALMEPFLDKGHILFTDNYYTSPSLATFLLGRNTHLCGTVKSYRKKYCKEIAEFALEKGEAVFFRSAIDSRVIACKYRAVKNKSGNKQKVVYMLSTCHSAKMIETGKTYANDSAIYKPSIVRSYNSHMGGVDRVDQQLHSLRTLCKSYKWYKKLAFRMISQVILNAHKVFQYETGKSKITFLDFLHETISSLALINPAIPNNQILDDTLSRLTGRHFLSLKVASPDAKDKRPTKRCRVCYAKRKLSAKCQPLKTTYVCRFCPSEPGLHPDTCFEAYHTQVNYLL